MVSFLPFSMVGSWALPLLQLLAQNNIEKRSNNLGSARNDFIILFLFIAFFGLQVTDCISFMQRKNRGFLGYCNIFMECLLVCVKRNCWGWFIFQIVVELFSLEETFSRCQEVL